MGNTYLKENYSFKYTDEEKKKFKYLQVKHSVQNDGKEQQQNKQEGNKGRNEIAYENNRED